MKTKEQILELHFGSDYWILEQNETLEYVLSAMEEYASQFKKVDPKDGYNQCPRFQDVTCKCEGVCQMVEDGEVEPKKEDPRDHPITGDDSWIHDIDMGAR